MITMYDSLGNLRDYITDSIIFKHNHSERKTLNASIDEMAA